MANDTSTKKKYLTFFQVRYQADNNSDQICYYNRDKKDTTFNSFLAVRKQTSTGNEIIFTIVKYIDKTNINDSIYTNISDELDGLNNNIVQFEQSVQGISENSTGRETTDRTKRRYTENDRRISKVIRISQSNKDKIERKYTATKIKSNNFLLNFASVGINREDFYNENFIFGVYLLITKNLNPFSLDRKLTDKNKHEILYMLWKECMPHKFYQHIYKENNFLYLNNKNVLQPKVSEIINEYLNEDTENYNEMRNNLSQYKNIFQYVYSNIFPEIYCCRTTRIRS